MPPAQQPNSAEAALLLNGQSGVVGLGPGDLVSVVLTGGVDREVLLAYGPLALAPLATPLGLLHLAGVDGFLLDGTRVPAHRTDAQGRFSITYQVPWLMPPGFRVDLQGAVAVPLAPLGFVLTAWSAVEVQGQTAAPQHLFFDPALGAKGTDNLLPPAGTLPGDLPTLDANGFEGPTQVFAGRDPVHGVFQNHFSCTLCHGNVPEIWSSYIGTMMANATRDPIFLGAFSVAVAGFEYLHQHQLSPRGGELGADYCLRCHSPNAWYSGRSGFEGDGTSTAFAPGIFDAVHALDQEGVLCDLCHRTVGFEPNRSPSAFLLPGQPDSGQLVLSPSLSKRGPFPGTSQTSFAQQTAYGALVPPAVVTSAPPVAHLPPYQEGTAVSPFHETDHGLVFSRSELCGSCHNITHPVTGHAVERTYTEWLNSDFGRQASPDFRTCQECHMPAVADARSCTLAGADPVYGAWDKVRGRIRQHEFVGGNAWIPQILKILHPFVDLPWTGGQNYAGLSYYGSPSRNAAYDAVTQAAVAQLRRAAHVDLTATEQPAGTILAQVRITNLTGHKLPTGYAEGRRMWIQVEALDAQGGVLLQSGFLDANSELVHDPALKVYEAEHGLDYPSLGLSGPSFHFGINNVVWKDNRILPKGGTQVKGVGGTDSYHPVLAPWPEGGLYPDGQHWDLTGYTIPVPPGTPRPVKVRATVLYQTASFAYVDFLANGGDTVVQTLPHPQAVALRTLWLAGHPAPAVPVGEVGPGSTADPTSPHVGQTAMVLIP
jgi:hypothetical protein